MRIVCLPKKFYTDVPNLRYVSSITRFLKTLGVTSEINVSSNSGYASSSSRGSCAIEYSVCNSGGYFVNFGGVYYNTETGYICLGYNGNSGGYIPVCSIVDFINSILYLDDSKKVVKVFDLDDINYMVEKFKINPNDFDFKTYLEEICSSKVQVSNSNSIIRSFMSLQSDCMDERLLGFNLKFLPDSNYEYFMCLVEGFSKLNLAIDEFCSCFVYGYSLESGFKELDRRIGDELNGRVTTSEKIEGCYIKRIRDCGVDPIFMREITSFSMGARMRSKVFSNSIDDEKKLKIVSSFYYLHNLGDYNVVVDLILDTYNIVDLLRSIGRDMDLYFSFDILYTMKNDSVLRSLITKLGLEEEISKVSYKYFMEYGLEYFKLVGFFIDSGSFDLLVSEKQKDFVSVSSRSLVGGGKIFERASGRMLKIFNK